MDITLKVNGRDFSSRVLKYSCDHEISFLSSVTTMDGVEHSRGKVDTVVLTFSLIPFSDAKAAEDYNTFSGELFDVEYTDPRYNATKTMKMRLASDLAASFGNKSVDGNRYYTGGEIVLRQGG